MGLICVQAVPAAEDQHTRLTVCTADEWKSGAGAQEYWFHSGKDATKILNEIVTLEAMFWTASRHEDGVLVEVSIDRIDAVIEECLKWIRLRLVTREEVDARTESVQQELDRKLVRLQCTGAMKTLNLQYKALRTQRGAGEKLPSFKNWLTQELERQILLPETLAAVMQQLQPEPLL